MHENKCNEFAAMKCVEDIMLSERRIFVIVRNSSRLYLRYYEYLDNIIINSRLLR